MKQVCILCVNTHYVVADRPKGGLNRKKATCKSQSPQEGSTPRGLTLGVRVLCNKPFIAKKGKYDTLELE